MPRRWRTAVALLLSLLLVAMQTEAHRHALSHFAASAAPQQVVWQASADTTCVECTLLAAGSAALVDQAPDTGGSPISDLQPDATFVAPAPAPPHFYRSRAPPPPS